MGGWKIHNAKVKLRYNLVVDALRNPLVDNSTARDKITLLRWHVSRAQDIASYLKILSLAYEICYDDDRGNVALLTRGTLTNE